MRLFVPILVIFLSFSSAFAAAKPSKSDVIAQASGNMYQFETSTPLEEAACTGMAIGPNALLTASHCEAASDKILINKLQDDDNANTGIATIVNIVRDEHDHSILYLKGETFPTWSKVLLNDQFTQGEHVFTIGNPGQSWKNIYMEGYIEGIYSPQSFFSAGLPEILFSFQAWHGDSGSGIFNKDGEIITVLTGIESPGDGAANSTVAFSLAFTPEQINKAINFTDVGFVEKSK